MLKGKITIRAIPMKAGCRLNVRTKMHIRNKEDKVHLLKAFMSALEITADEAERMFAEIKSHLPVSTQ